MPVPGPSRSRAFVLLLLRWKIIAQYALPRWGSVFRSGVRGTGSFLLSRKTSRHPNIVAWLPTALLALLPWGTSMLGTHPCFAWTCWIAAWGCAAYAGWRTLRIYNWMKLLAIVLGSAGVGAIGAHSLFSHTELSFPFVNPGVFLVQDHGQWLLLVTGEDTHVPLFNVDMFLEDANMDRAAIKEPDMTKRTMLIRGSMLQKVYPEIGPTFTGDKIMWTPIDVNDQDYVIQFRYRIGDGSFLTNEEIKIVNTGIRFVTPDQMAKPPSFQMSVTATTEMNKQTLMRCADPALRTKGDTRRVKTCFPGANYRPFARSLCARCFSEGFQVFQQ